MISVTGVRCVRCGHVVVSRAGHDQRSCECGAVQVDGGRDYLRVVYYGEDSEHEFVRLDLPVEDERELYVDWNERTDKHGFYPPETHFALNLREPTEKEIDNP